MKSIKSFDQTFSKVWPPAGPPEAARQHMVTRALAVFLLFLLIVPAVIFSSPLADADSAEVKAQGTVIVDFSGVNKDSGTLVYRLFGLDIAEIVTRLNKNLPADKKIDLCLVLGARGGDKIAACRDRVTDESDKSQAMAIYQARAAFLNELKKKYKRAAGQRWLSKKNHLLEVYVFHTGKNAEIKIEEKKRHTKLVQDISTLTKLVVSYATREGEVINLVDKQYRLEKRHGVLQVAVSLDKGEKKGEQREEKLEILTGPAEHWFLSADLPALKLSKVKFTGDQGSLEPKETPKVFYLGVNWMIGDVLKERQHLLKNFFIKGMVKFAKKPLASYGFGIGYRFPAVRVLGVDISAFSVFASLLWTKEEVEDKTEELTKRQVQLGIGFNLDKALGWIK